MTRDEFMCKVLDNSGSDLDLGTEDWLSIDGERTLVRLSGNILRIRLPDGTEIAGSPDHLSIAGEGVPIEHLDPAMLAEVGRAAGMAVSTSITMDPEHEGELRIAFDSGGRLDDMHVTERGEVVPATMAPDMEEIVRAGAGLSGIAQVVAERDAALRLLAGTHAKLRDAERELSEAGRNHTFVAGMLSGISGYLERSDGGPNARHWIDRINTFLGKGES